MEFTIVDGRTFVTGHPHALIRSVKGGREGGREGHLRAPVRPCMQAPAARVGSTQWQTQHSACHQSCLDR